MLYSHSNDDHIVLRLNHTAQTLIHKKKLSYRWGPRVSGTLHWRLSKLKLHCTGLREKRFEIQRIFSILCNYFVDAF